MSATPDPLATLPVEHIPPDILRPHPENYRTHPEEQLAHITASIRLHGIYRPIVIARDNTILAGHGVVQAAKAIGLATVPAVRLPIDPHSHHAIKLLIGDNEIGHLAEIDDRALSEVLRDIKRADEATGLLATGYDEAKLADLLLITRPKAEIPNWNAAAAYAGMDDFEPVPDPLKLVVSFRSPEDRAAFCQALDLRLADSTRSAWWPQQEPDEEAPA